MRLFVAAYPPADACDDLADRLEKLHVVQAGARVAWRDTWHITLAFLGEVADEQEPAAVAALDRAAAAWRSAQGAFEVRLAGGGRFGRGRSTVLWVGVEGPSLAALSEAVRDELSAARLPYDAKPFTPHLTIARPGDTVDRALVEADRAELAGYRGPAWPVATVELVRSRLGRTASYDRLGSWPLA
jgi:RNA 2',3'-cyclic 3'-phosphodiesterase